MAVTEGEGKGSAGGNARTPGVLSPPSSAPLSFTHPKARERERDSQACCCALAAWNVHKTNQRTMVTVREKEKKNGYEWRIIGVIGYNRGFTVRYESGFGGVFRCSVEILCIYF